MTTQQQTIRHTLEQLRDGVIPGQTTWFDDGFNPTVGYIVGNGSKGLQFERHAWSDNLLSTASYLGMVTDKWKEHRHLTDCEGYGFWLDENILYVDPVTHVTDRTQAILMGMARKELAIWDIENQCCINMSNYVLAEVTSHVD